MNQSSFDGELGVTEESSVASTLEQTDKKCPACDGTLNFDPASGMLVCAYCGKSVAIDFGADGPQSAEELDFFRAKERESCDWGTQTKVVECKNCGAKTVYDALETAGECPYCGSNQVMEASDEDTLAPGGICPFAVDETAAGDCFKIWLKRRWFCPSSVKKNVGKLLFHGMYLPYWTFDTNTDSYYTARYGITRTRTVGSGKNRRTETYTSWYRTDGYHKEFINDCLIKGTVRHDQAILSKIEPFNTEANVAYRPEFLAGFVAERYSVGLEDAWENAKVSINRILENSVEREIRRYHHADKVDSIRLSTKHHDITYKYLMLPIWASHFTYRSKSYQFMVNGQTGRVGGRTPVSPWRVLLAVLIGLGLAALVFMLMIVFSENGIAAPTELPSAPLMIDLIGQ